MADLFQIGDVSSWTESSAASPDGSGLSTGDLRRRNNFGSRVSELAIAQDPFLRFVSKVGKNPVDDPEFKFTERRPSFHKRYAYVDDHGTTSALGVSNSAVAASTLESGDTYYVKMVTDYKAAGNISNVLGQSGTKSFMVGSAGTAPAFYMKDQLIRIPLGTAAATGGSSSALTFSAAVDYAIGKVKAVSATGTAGQLLELKIVRAPVNVASTTYLTGWFHDGSTVAAPSALTTSEYSGLNIATQLEKARSYVVGSAHAQGSGYPETWRDQPFSTGYGRTQIWKTAMAMDNTTRATVLKYEGNEWARIWREKLIEHKWDIEQSLLFGTEADVDGAWQTQGAVDYILSYGNIFDGSTIGTTKSQDDFLDDMSQIMDPRYNNSNATLFFVGTDVYNWLHKLSGYISANMKQTDLGSGNRFGARMDFSMGGRKNAFGVDITQIYTPYGVMNVTRNIHLDGTDVKILGINMKYCKYRPLVGNGLNRDTAIYVGVQTLENSGIDRRVDLIQTEAGMEWQMPEAHAIWK